MEKHARKPHKPHTPSTRQRAEEELGATADVNLDALSPETVRQLVRELRIRQRELEMQNEELRRTQEALEADRTRLATLYNLAPAGLLTLDDHGRILASNRTAETLLGIPGCDLLHRPLRHFVSPEDRHEFDRFFRRLHETQQSGACAVCIRRHNGAQFPGRLAGVAGQDGDSGFVVRVVLSDLSGDEREVIRQQSEEKYRTLFENMAQGVFYQSADGTLVDCNPAALAMFGLTREAFLNRTSLAPEWSVIREDGSDFPGDEHPSMRALQTGKPVRDVVAGVYNPRKKDYVWMSINAIPQFRTGDDRPYQVFVTLHDISEQKRTAAALQESEKKYRDLFDTAADGIMVLDGDNKVLDVNQRACDMLGYPCEELRAINVTTLIHPEDLMRKDHAVAIEALSRGETIYSQYRLRRKDGRYISTELSTKMIAEGRFLNIARDITGRLRAETQTRISEANLRSLLDNREDFIWSVDRNYNYIIFNKTYAQMYLDEHGVAPEPGMSSIRFLTPEQRALWISMFESVFAGKPIAFELSHVLGDSLRHFRTSVAPIYAGDAITGASAISTDITDLKEAEIALRESERKFHSVIRQATDGIMLADEQGYINEWNHALENITGIPASAMLGQRIWDAQLALLPPAERTPQRLDAIKQLQQHALRTGDLAYAGEVLSRVYDHPDGTRRHLQGSVFTIETDRGYMLCSLTRDVTAQREAENEVREQLQWNQVVLDTIFDGYILADAEGRIRQVNPRYCALSGYTEDELTQMNIRDVEAQLSPEEVVAQIALIMQMGHAHFETTHRAKGGHPIELDVSITIFQSAGEPLMAAFVRDISERKRVEESLRRQTEILQTILDHIPVMIAYRDPQGRHQWLNRAYQETLGVRLEGLQSYDLLGTFYPDSDVRRHVETFIAAADGTWGDFRTHTLDGRVLDTIWANVRLYDGADIGIGVDISEQKKAEAERQQLLEQVRRYAGELEQRVVDRTRELTLLYDLASVANRNQNLDLAQTLEYTLHYVLEAMQCAAGAIHLVGDAASWPDALATGDTGAYVVVHQGFSDKIAAQRERVTAGSGLIGLVLLQNEPVVTPSASDAPRVLVKNLPPGIAGPHVYVPIHIGERVAGVLTVCRAQGMAQFTAEDVALLVSIADQMGVVIESTRLRTHAQEVAVLRERDRLARELHDSITQSLYSLVLFADWAQRLGAAGQFADLDVRLARIGEVAHQALKEMRLLLYELRPSTLEQDGLAGALQRRLDAVERRAGITVDFDAAIEYLPPDIELALYRIAQEALNNALKHAAAHQVSVFLAQTGNRVTLSVRDDGVGFEPETAAESGGLGLRSIRERVERLNGEWTLVAEPGSGTTITVTVEVPA